MSHISILYLIPFFLYWYIGFVAHSYFKDVSIIMNNESLTLVTNVTIFLSFYLGCLAFYHALAAAYYKVRTLNQVEIRMLVLLYIYSGFITGPTSLLRGENKGNLNLKEPMNLLELQPLQSDK